MTVKGMTEPRIWTRRAGAGSRGSDFQRFARDILGINLHPWQEWVADKALQVANDGHYIYDTTCEVGG